MIGNEPNLDILDVLDAFDVDEAKNVLRTQMSALRDEACEILVDNFKNLYARYKTIRDGEIPVPFEAQEEVQEKFYDICQMYINQIDEFFGLSISEEYITDHQGNLPSIALQLYLFFVLDLRSNLFNVLLSFIGERMTDIVAHFEELRQRKDSITSVNNTMHDQNIALICSNIYDVVDWALGEMDGEDFFNHMEQDYIALAPIRNLYTEGSIDGGFLLTLRDIVKENLAMKGKICFDIICRLKGFNLNV